MRMIITQEQALYGAEALVILCALPIGVMLTLWALFPAIFVAGALLALGLAVTGFVKPGYFSPIGLTDPRRAWRRYLHLVASLSVVPAVATIIAGLDFLFRR